MLTKKHYAFRLYVCATVEKQQCFTMEGVSMKNRIIIIVICMIACLSGIMAGAKSVHAASFITANNPSLGDSGRRIATFPDSYEPNNIFTKKYKVCVEKTTIRKGPGTSYASDGIIYKNDIVYVSSIKNGWAKFKLRGEWRYVKASHLERVK